MSLLMLVPSHLSRQKRRQASPAGGAPPVYRPAPTKSVAPRVFRPQLPVATQPKAAPARIAPPAYPPDVAGQGSSATRPPMPPARVAPPVSRPGAIRSVALPAYRPQQPGITQPKASPAGHAPPVYRPSRSAPGTLPASFGPVSVARKPLGSPVVQRAERSSEVIGGGLNQAPTHEQMVGSLMNPPSAPALQLPLRIPSKQLEEQELGKLRRAKRKKNLAKQRKAHQELGGTRAERLQAAQEASKKMANLVDLADTIRDETAGLLALKRRFETLKSKAGQLGIGKAKTEWEKQKKEVNDL